jgi:hypothetical protein
MVTTFGVTCTAMPSRWPLTDAVSVCDSAVMLRRVICRVDVNTSAPPT